MVKEKKIDLERARIAHGLRRLREDRNYSQEYVAEVLEKNDSSAYSRIEQGRTELKFDDAFKLAALYKVSMEQIFDPSLRNVDQESFSEQREKYNLTPKLNLSVTLDGTPETLKKQLDLLESVNNVLARQG